MNSEYRKAYLKEYNRKWYQEHKSLNRESHKAWMKAHPEVGRKGSRKYVNKIRLEAVLKLGGACICCGCTDMRCLEIDHILPTGKKRGHRQALHLSILQGNMENLQVLCACCHSIKTFEE